MNRFAHPNIDPSVTNADRLRVMTKKIGPSKAHARRHGRATGRDDRAGRHLEARLHGYEKVKAGLNSSDVDSITRPGSMQRNKRK